MSSERLVIEITGDSTKLVGALKSAENRLTSFNTRVTNSSRNLTNLNKQIAGLGFALAGLTASANASAAAMARTGAATRATGARMQVMRTQVGGLVNSFRQMVVGLSSVQTMFYQYAFFLGGFVASIIHVNSIYETQLVLLKNLSKASTEAGKAAEAKQNVNYIWDLAANAPFSVNSLTDAFVKLKVAGIEPTNGSLQALTDSVAAFGGSSDNLKRAAVAIQQMGGKGVISMEELRQQLGESVPNAMYLMASAMKMNMRDFVKEVSEGGVQSKNALEKMFVAMQIVNGGKAKEMMNTWTGLMAKLSTAYQKFVVSIMQNQGSENGFFATLKTQIDELTVFLNSPFGAKFARDVSEALARIVIGIGNLIKFVYEWRDVIIAVAKVFFAVWAGKMVLGTVTGAIAAFTRLNVILKTIAVTMVRVTTVANGLQLVTLLFGKNVAKAGMAAGIFNSRLQISISRLAGFAARAIAANGPMIILIGTIWAAVAAYNAYNNVRNQSARLSDIAENGGVLSEEDKKRELSALDTRRQALQKRRQELETARRAFGPEVFARLSKAFNDDVKKFNVDASRLQGALLRTYEANDAQAVANWSSRLSATTDKMVGDVEHQRQLREKAINDDKSLTEQQKTDKIHDSYLTSLEQLEKGYSERYDSLAKTIAEGESKHGKAVIAAAKEEQAKVLAAKNAATEGKRTLMTPNPPSMAKGDDKDKAAKSDGLDGLRNRLVNLTVSTAELKSEIAGTQAEFDSWDTEQIAQANADAIKSEVALKKAISDRRAEQLDLKAELKVKEAMEDIANEFSQQSLTTAEAFQEMRDGYVSIESSINRYRDRLDARYQDELKLAILLDAKDRANGIYADREEKLLHRLNDLENTRHEEMVINAAIEADQIYEKRLTELMTEDERREFYFQKQMRRLESEYQAALELGEGHEEAARRIKRAMDALSAGNNEARQGPFAAWARDAADFKPKLDAMFTGVLDGFVNDLAAGQLSFKKFAKSLLADLLKIIIRALIAKAILSAIGMAGGGGGSVDMGGLNDTMNFNSGALSAGVYHTGGIIGTKGMSKSIDEGMFAFAKRYHSGGMVGLGPNEVPIIAEKGEGVFTQEQMRAMGGNQKAPNVQVNVINQTGTDAQVERKPPRWDGEKMVEDIILKKMSQPGPVRDAMNMKR